MLDLLVYLFSSGGVVYTLLGLVVHFIFEILTRIEVIEVASLILD